MTAALGGGACGGLGAAVRRVPHGRDVGSLAAAGGAPVAVMARHDARWTIHFRRRHAAAAKAAKKEEGGERCCIS